MLKNAACNEGHVEMGQAGAGASGGQGEPGEGGMKQKPGWWNHADLGEDWEIGRNVIRIEERLGIKTKQ